MTTTPRPWTLHKGQSIRVPHRIDGANGAIVANTYWDNNIMDNGDEPQGNAAFIIRAVNLHDELVAALEVAHELIQYDGCYLGNGPEVPATQDKADKIWNKFVDAIEAVLAKVKGDKA